MKNFNEINAVSAETKFAEIPSITNVNAEERGGARRYAALRSSRPAQEADGKQPAKRKGRRKLGAGDKTIQIGGRKLLRRPDEVVIARQSRTWVMTAISTTSTGDWANVKLYCHRKKSRKRVYYLGIHKRDRRLGNNHDSGVLQKYEPDMVQWVIENAADCEIILAS